MVRITPALPCCDSCVLLAARRAGFDYSSAFVVASGLEELAPQELAQFVGSMVSATKARAFLFVETPLADDPESEESDEEGEAVAPASEDGEPEGSN